MRTITTIGLDIAKSVFQVHAVDEPCQLGAVHTWPIADIEMAPANVCFLG
jgi:hypothetical protein